MLLAKRPTANKAYTILLPMTGLGVGLGNNLVSNNLVNSANFASGNHNAQVSQSSSVSKLLK